MPFRPRRRPSAGMRVEVRKLATWARACTPASVRPAPRRSTGSCTILPMASSTVSWTVRAFGCRCQPAKSVPSNSSTSRRLRTARLLELEVQTGRPGEIADVELVREAEAGDVGVGELAEEADVADA